MNAATGAVVEQLPTELGPSGVGFDPRFGLVYILNFDSASVQVVDAATFQEVRVLGGRRWANGPVGRPEDIVLGLRGIMLVSTTDGFLMKLRRGRVVTKKPVLSWGDDHQLAVDRRQELVYAAQLDAGSILELRLRDLSKVGSLTPRHSPWDVSVDPRLGLLGVVTDTAERAGFEVFDLSRRKWIARIELGLGGNDIVTLAGSWHFYVGDDMGDSVLVLPGEDTPPISDSQLTDNGTMQAGQPFAGSTSDNRSGIAAVDIIFDNGVQKNVRVAELSCSSPRQCAWTSRVPEEPGVYQVITAARDVAGNVEDADAITVTVIP